MRRYTVVLIPDDEEGGYTVTVPAFPACITEGDDRAEALANAGDVIRTYLEVLAERRQPYPDDTSPSPEDMAEPGATTAVVEVDVSTIPSGQPG